MLGERRIKKKTGSNHVFTFINFLFFPKRKICLNFQTTKYKGYDTVSLYKMKIYLLVVD